MISKLIIEEINKYVNNIIYDKTLANNMKIANNALRAIKNGEKVENVFQEDDVYNAGYKNYKIVCLNKKYNILDIDNMEYISNYWFDEIFGYKDNGLCKVILDNNWNFIDTEGFILVKEKINVNKIKCDDFIGNLAQVSFNKYDDDDYFKKYNFINKTNGYFINSEWFDDIDEWEDNALQVKINGYHNIIDTDGNFLLSKWIEYNIYDNKFNDGLLKVSMGFNNSNSLINFVDKNGNLLLKKPLSYYFIDSFNNGYAKICNSNRKYNFINKNGEEISKQWFDYVDEFHNGFAKIEINNFYNFINGNGDLIRDDIWFEDAEDFENGEAVVYLKDSDDTFILKTNGEIKKYEY